MQHSTSPGGEFYERQVAYLENRDFDGLMEQYHKDAVLVTFDKQVNGNVEIRRHLEEYLDHLGSLKLKSTDKFTETEDSIFFEATMITDHAEAQVYDVFILQAGKATHHFTGVIAIHPFSDPTSEG